ncbi:DUF167 domain-containing protein [Rubinisphaera italica]|uniref:UPF0235 protein Pan54_28360 n=1 Tax=Rubinisphaera italica TaxID=2527969 RepID=A0A5C5XGB6_9PLAN|nr:DUF167 domain-containing protein [Rubinisphaera italica]TWT62097.1 hypothetical protein Pan54_28360 [Rubinisphaera italica]
MGRLHLKVVPSSSRDQIVGWLGEALKIKVKAPPEKGKANASVIELIATKLNIPRESMSLISGETSPVKVIEIQGVDNPQLKQRVEDALNSI